MTWAVAFALTQVVEVPLYLAGMRGWDESWPWRAGLAFGASALTHPIVWFVLPALIPSIGWVGYFAVAETFAVAAEWAYLRAAGCPRAGWLALAANGTSATIGLGIGFLVSR